MVDAMQKELMALEKSNVCKFHPRHYEVSKKHQKAPLRMIFDLKKKDLRNKARHVVGGYKID